MSHIENLISLRNNLANRKMSLLVGAGFSKNVSSAFPDWVQLLQDLVYELYGNEIETRLQPEATPKQREKQLLEETRKLIEKVGYLKVVSEYISRKGYEEAIVSYIEKNTPIEEAVDGMYYLINEDGSKELLTEDKLYLHKFLLSFPWNNVFTTNYDPLLEASVDTKLHSTLKEENEELLASINGMHIQLAAAKGVQLFIETHSDHVLNGIRVAVKKLSLDPSTVALFYFDRNINAPSHETVIHRPRLDQN